MPAWACTWPHVDMNKACIGMPNGVQVTNHWEKFTDTERSQLVQLAFSLFLQGALCFHASFMSQRTDITRCQHLLHCSLFPSLWPGVITVLNTCN